MSQSILDVIKAKRAQLNNNTGRTVNLKAEKNLVRILPNWAGDPNGVFFHDFGQHWIKNQKGETKAVYICSQNTFGTDCPICEALAHAAASTTDEATLEAIKESRGSKRIIVNAMYFNGPHDNAKTKPCVLEIPPTVFDQILSQAETYAAEGINVFDPEAGHNMIIEKKGTGRNTEYMVSVSPKAVAVPEGVMSMCKDLEAFAHQESEMELSKSLTTVRAISGVGASSASPRLVGPGAKAAAAKPESANKLASLDPSVIEGDFEEVSGKTVSKSQQDTDDLDQLLAELG